MRRVAFYTLGCKVNQYETEAMRELFVEHGDEIVDADAAADVYVVNTCTVTGMSDKKSRQMIRRFKRQNPEALIAVVGCYSQIAPSEILAIDGVNLVMGTHQRRRIVEYLEKMSPEDRREVVTDVSRIREFEEMTIDRVEGKTRAFVKIQDGCDRFCSYCIIPYARGPVRSREPEKVVEEVRRLSEKGFREVVLTGIHVASYGKDLADAELTPLIGSVAALEGIDRIRLSSLEPTVMTEAFVRALSKHPKVCPHFHLSLQSGCDSVLTRMNRKYDTALYREAVERIRAYWPLAAITTDIITGFPGETDEEFETTLRFVEEMAFAQVHAFSYSPREGTPAATMANPVAPEVKQVRTERLIALADRMESRFLEQFRGKRLTVLVEGVHPDTGMAEGLTDTYLKVRFKAGRTAEGSLVQVVILGNDGKELTGTPWEIR